MFYMKKCVVLVYRHNIDKTLGNYNNWPGLIATGLRFRLPTTAVIMSQWILNYAIVQYAIGKLSINEKKADKVYDKAKNTKVHGLQKWSWSRSASPWNNLSDFIWTADCSKSISLRNNMKLKSGRACYLTYPVFVRTRWVLNRRGGNEMTCVLDTVSK